MNVRVNLPGGHTTEIPFSQIAEFLILCDLSGLQSQWDEDGMTVHLKRKGKMTVVLNLDPSVSTYVDLMYLTTGIRHLVSDMGIEMDTKNEPQGHLPTCDLNIVVALVTTTHRNNSKVSIAHNLEPHQYHLIPYVSKYFDSRKIRCDFNRSKRDPRLLKILCILPAVGSTHPDKSDLEKVAIGIASLILLFFQTHRQISQALLPYLLSWTQRESSQNKDSTTLSQPMKPDDTAKENLPIEKRVAAQVFFTNTIVRHDVLEDVLILGSLYIKNTGTETLDDPVVCINASPAKDIHIRGHIIPPEMVQTIAVHDNSGAKGWQYVYADWLERSKNQGEYWISPIRSSPIPPLQTLALENMQIFIKKQSESHAKITAVVYFAQQGIEFHSENQIIVS